MVLDVALVHAPSVYDFRDRDDILFAYLANSDSVHVSPIFEMPPIGVIAIEQYLKSMGKEVVFYNVASHMLRESKFDVEDFLGRLDAKFLGIDLHWLAHAQGALELAAIYKKYHPQGKVFLGGISATHFHKEVISYSHVDYVLRGADTLEAVFDLIESENQPDRLMKVSGLTWKHDERVITNTIQKNADTYSVSVDWNQVFCGKTGEVTPYNLVIPQYGCEYNCYWCGGSRYTNKKELNLDGVVQKKPNMLERELQSILKSGSRKHTITMINYWHEYEELLNAVNDVFCSDQIDKVHISVRRLPKPERFAKLDWGKKLVIELSPDSHKIDICRGCGHGHYTMEEMEEFIDALMGSVYSFEVYFIIGVPGQTKENVLDTVEYCEQLLKKYEGKRVIPYICPMLPFLDPGSVFYDKAEKFGYRILHKSFEDYRTALLSMNWKDRLNYETRWMSRDDLVDITYEAVRRLTELKAQYRILPRGICDGIVELIDRTKDILAQIDFFQNMPETSDKEKMCIEIKKMILEYNREQLSRVRSQQRPLDLGFARLQWFDTEAAFKSFYEDGRSEPNGR